MKFGSTPCAAMSVTVVCGCTHEHMLQLKEMLPIKLILGRLNLLKIALSCMEVLVACRINADINAYIAETEAI